MNTRIPEDRTIRLLPGGVPRYVRLYDNGGATADRFTVCFTGNNPRFRHPYVPGWGQVSYPILSMSGAPFHPQGVCMHSEYPHRVDQPRYRHLGKRITFADLPADCQTVVLRDYRDFWEVPD